MKSTVLSHNFTGKSLVMVVKTDGKTKTNIVQHNHPQWAVIVDLYAKKKYGQIVPMLELSSAIATQFKGKFTTKDGKVYYGGEEVHGYLVDRILYFLREMPDQADRLLKFAANLYANPDVHVRQELYKFLEHKHMPITEDGCFLAYKGVQSDYYSYTSGDIEVLKGKVKDGKILNAVGEEIEVRRSQVCADKNVGCSRGIHAGSFSYAQDFKQYNGHLMIVKINPRNAVSVPSDCNYQKLRTCAYTVIAEEDFKLDEKHDNDFDKKDHKQSFRDSLGRFAKAIKNRFK